jgi:glutaminase-like protein
VPVGLYGAPQQPIGTTPTVLIKQTVRVMPFGDQNAWRNVRLLSGPSAGSSGWVHSVDVTEAKDGEALDAAEVSQLFVYIRDDARFTFNGANHPIPYHFPKDGCFARAEVMKNLFKGLGYTCDKEFVISRGGLRVKTPYGGDQLGYGERLQVDWWYHVAPVLYQKAGGGKPTPWVIDPSVATTPLTPAAWADTAKTQPVANFLKDWQYTFVGAAIEKDVQQMIVALNS